MNGRLQHLAETQGSVFFQQIDPAAEIAGNNAGKIADFLVALALESRWLGGVRRCAGHVQRDDLFRLASYKVMKPAPLDLRARRFDDAQGGGDGDHGVKGVAALLEDVRAGWWRRVSGRDHAADAHRLRHAQAIAAFGNARV